MSTVLTHFQEGGFFMWFILLFGIGTAALVIERSLSLFSRTSPAPSEFRAKMAELIARGDFRSAESYAQAIGASHAEGRVAALGVHLRSNAGGQEEVQARMDEKLSSEISRMDRRTGFLAMFGNVATLLGLLGTISGMIQSFAAVANASPADRATMLSKGISEAMNCTAFGLIVAIPALVAYAVFQNRTDRLVSSLTETVTEIFHDLVYLAGSGASPEARNGKSSGSASTYVPSQTAQAGQQHSQQPSLSN
jgi:biopolymer transport protein ExbB